MFTRNYHAMKSYQMFSKAPVVVTSYGGDTSHENSIPNIKSLLSSLKTSYSAGVILGDGTDEPTLYDYKLSGNIITGFTYSYSVESGNDESGPWVKAKYTITNNNSNAVTISEIGLMGGSTVCLMERTLLERPITIDASGGVGQLEYTIRYDVPTMEPEINLDQDGVYGVEWNYSSGATKLTRFGDSRAFSDPAPATALDGEGNSPFDALMPWSGMKRYNIIDGAVGASEDDEGFTMTGADTMVYIPEFYYAVQDIPYEQRMRWAISMTEKEGFRKHPGSGRYIGRYHTSVSSSVYGSKSGTSPKTSITRASFRTYSHNKGAKWWQMDYATWSAVQLLYLVEYADWNSQSMLGTGQNSRSVKSCGSTDSCVYHTLKRDGASNQYRWIEDPYSNVYDFVDGIISSGGYYYLSEDNSRNSDATSDHVGTGKYFANSTGGYIGRYHYVDKFPWAFIPRATGGAENAYVTDYAHSDGGNGPYVSYVGGYYSSSAQAGFFYLNSVSSASSVNAFIGSRLLYIP